MPPIRPTFEEVVVPLYDADWDKRREGAEFAPSSGKVPILWDGEAVVWDSLAIIDFLADKVGRDRFWPEDDAARAMARRWRPRCIPASWHCAASTA